MKTRTFDINNQTYSTETRGALSVVLDGDGDSVLWSEKLIWCELAAASMNAQLVKILNHDKIKTGQIN